MAAPYFQNTSIANIDGLFAELRSQLLAVAPTPYTELVLNSSTTDPGTGLVGRESHFKLPTNVGQENQIGGGYLGLCRYVNSAGTARGLILYAYTSRRAPATISTISRAANVVTVTTTAPHGFSTGDLVIVNGTDTAGFHEGSTGAITAINTITVTGATTFTYASPAAGALAGTGGTAVAVFNVTSSRTMAAADAAIRINVTDAPMSVYGYRDAHRICGIVQQGGQNRVFYLGTTGREHVQTAGSSCVVSTSPIAVGANTITADRIPANMYIGQRLWIVSADSGTSELTTVTGLTGASISFTAANVYNAGAYIGWDPTPLISYGLTGALTTTADMTSVISYIARYALDIDGGRSSPQNDLGNVVMTSNIDIPLVTGDEGASDPDSAGFFQGRDFLLIRTAAPEGQRKYLPGFTAWPLGYQNEYDIQRIGATPVTDDIKIFVSQPASSQSQSFVLGIGPGATNP